MNLMRVDTGTRLALSFILIILLTLAIVLVSYYSLNEIEEKTNNYYTVLEAQKNFLTANLHMESYLYERDSIQFAYASFYLDSAIQTLKYLRPRLKGEYVVVVDDLLVKFDRYKQLIQESYDAIGVQNEIYYGRRKMRIVFTDQYQKSNIQKNHNIVIYFNRARLYAVYLLSSNDRFYYDEVRRYIDLAISEAEKLHNQPIKETLEKYMISVTENYEISLKIKDAKNAQLSLKNDILEKSGNMITLINAYQARVRRSTRISMLVFSVISVIISIVISRIIVVYATNKQRIIEENNKKLTEQTLSLGETNTLLEERQQQIEEQSEELKVQRDKLSELNATKDKLFSVLAHDLKNPFNTILGFSDLLLINVRNYSLDKIELQVQQIRNATKSAYELLNNLLQWSRSQRGIIGFHPEKLVMSKFVKKELEIIHQQAAQKDIVISIKAQLNEDPVEADPNLIGTVIRNLITNAIKFSHKGSKIDIGFQFKNGMFDFFVKDYGVGMPKEVQDKLFKISDMDSTAGTQGEKGTGLGLLVCADFINKHQGEIGVESEVGAGSTFSFSIPVKQAEG